DEFNKDGIAIVNQGGSMQEVFTGSPRMERIGGKYGLINENKELLNNVWYGCVEKEFNQYSYGFQTGDFRVNIGGKEIVAPYLDENTHKKEIERLVGENRNMIKYKYKKVEGGKWGIIYRNGKEKCPPIYNHIGYFRDGIAPVNQGGNIGGIFLDYGYGFAVDCFGGKWGFIDNHGKEVCNCKYDSVEFLQECWAINIGGMQSAPFDEYGQREIKTEGGKWGIINSEGKEICPPKYDYIGVFRDGFALVNIGGYNKRPWGFQGGRWGIIDSHGREITPCVNVERPQLPEVKNSRYRDWDDDLMLMDEIL
ncbi:WG repeat-containing protein, partial [Odoribacter sp. OttesenSCG-928-L07]|nr:WG repeat-containing protein [Odoribacter sp. OttesenSCG-928-L07]